MKNAQDEEERKQREKESKENEDSKDDDEDEDVDEEENNVPDVEVSGCPWTFNKPVVASTLYPNKINNSLLLYYNRYKYYVYKKGKII